MFSYLTLSKILFKNSFGKAVLKFWSRDYLSETNIRFLATFLKRNIFLNVIFAD